MFRKSLFNEIEFESNSVGWSIAFELSIKTQLLGLKVGEVPIVSVDRLFGGTLNFKLGPWCIEYLRWIFWGLRNLRLLRKHKRILFIILVIAFIELSGYGILASLSRLLNVL